MDKLVQAATRNSVSLFHNYLGTEHFMLVAIDDGTVNLAQYGVTRADFVRELQAALATHVSSSNTLRSVGIDLAQTQATAKAELGVDLLQRQPDAFGSMTPRMQGILASAKAAAGDREVSSKDVVRAIVDEGGNLSVVVLERLGVPVDELV